MAKAMAVLFLLRLTIVSLLTSGDALILSEASRSRPSRRRKSTLSASTHALSTRIIVLAKAMAVPTAQQTQVESSGTVFVRSSGTSMSLAKRTISAAQHLSRVKTLYRRALKLQANWEPNRDAWIALADQTRRQFEVQRGMKDTSAIDGLVASGYAKLKEWAHPNPYIIPWEKDGTMYDRNSIPPVEVLTPPTNHLNAEKYKELYAEIEAATKANLEENPQGQHRADHAHH